MHEQGYTENHILRLVAVFMMIISILAIAQNWF